MENLKDYFYPHAKTSLKIAQHGELYNKLFSPIKDKEITMLEIGVWTGTSLKAWKAFFSNVKLYGIDINMPVDETIKDLAQIFIGDQSYAPFMLNVAETIGSLDVVIDDGGHWADDQQVSFNCLWPNMRSGGMYIIEDLWVADANITDGYESTNIFLEKLDVRKEYYTGNNNFEKDICVLYKE